MTTVQELYVAAPTARVDDRSPEGAEPAADLLAAVADHDGPTGVALACVLLAHGHLEAAHDLANTIGGTDGDFAHALMHRMEGDYGNTSYWHRRHGHHPVHDSIERALTAGALPAPPALARPYGADSLTSLLIDGASTDDPMILALHNAELAGLVRHCVI